uniref:Uncharacterized protein n=1 Tax=Ditylenchus dipsaci TaxID=166011 RepID=A0A915EDR6_9BILA
MVASVLTTTFIAVFIALAVYHFEIIKGLEAKSNLKLQELESSFTEHNGQHLVARGEFRGRLLFTFNIIPLLHKEDIEIESDRKEIGGMLLSVYYIKNQIR